MPLAPIVPDYQGRSVVNVIPALTSTGRPGPLGDLTQALSGASAVVLVLLDGLGALQLSERSALAPVMAGAQMQPLTSVAPSTTAAALTSLTTGVAPGEHGIVGYRFRLGTDTLQALRWSVNERDAMKAHPPDLIQRITPLLTRDGEGVPYVGDRKFAKSGFTRAHLRGATYVGISNVEELVASTVSSSQTSPFVIAYHDTIDKTAHSKGLEAHYDAALSEADGIVHGTHGTPDRNTHCITSSPPSNRSDGEADDVPGLVAAGLFTGADHPKRVGDPDEIPFLKRQTRLTFVRCGIVDPASPEDYRIHGGWRGL